PARPRQPRTADGSRNSRGADDNAVEIVRETLRLHQRLATAIRAAIEIRALRTVTSERCNYRLGLVGGFFERSISEVDNFLGMAECERRQTPGLTAVIRRGGDVTAPDRVSEAVRADATEDPATAELLIFSVETAVGRYPDLEFDD